MKKSAQTRQIGASILALAASAALAGTARADADIFARARVTPAGTIVTPGSSIARPQDRGRAAHTNVEIFVPRGAAMNASAPAGVFETPASLACVYGLTAAVTGCNPETLTTVATGGSKTIAIVDAFDYPTAAADLSAFSKQFGLPAITGSNFRVVYASGSVPPHDSTGDWEVEEALDIEMAHALAPGANIILVEAASNSYADLYAAEKTAGGLVAAAGGGEVSNSWGGNEFSNEEDYEKYFKAANVVFFASTGDTNGPEVPATLSNVVAVGGTSIVRTLAGDFQGQVTWSDTGGGKSLVVPLPSYQHGLKKVLGTVRGTPDVALDANPLTGVWIYDTTPYGGNVLNWTVIGGTSVASPAVAALVNNAGTFNVNTEAELKEIYTNRGNVAEFTDITSGSCPNAASGRASKRYDLCTGIGTPLGVVGK